ncbi:hypothetical protein LPJ56_000663 [Coemansia sp. RSA 2599]|nr:hypothetical protein LPJ75_000357 [Coemansia sp. RSA 2598]KAJ1829063.1 hypothetical protein LPJ56_000663 [Coemansia sp. RSA 2599]
MNLAPPPAYTPRSPETIRMTQAARANLATLIASADTPRASSASTSAATGGTPVEAEGSRHMFLFQLIALLVGVFTIKFMLSLIRVVLDCLLYMLALSCVLAFVRPGPKDGPVLTVLSYVEAVVDPIYTTMADRVSRVASGPIMTLSRYLKTRTNSRGPAASAS